MAVDELRAAGERLLAQARAVRAAFPDPAAMRGVAIDPLPSAGGGGRCLCAALRNLRDEVVLVRNGEAGTLAVLDDEIAIAERELARLPPARG